MSLQLPRGTSFSSFFFFFLQQYQFWCTYNSTFYVNTTVLAAPWHSSVKDTVLRFKPLPWLCTRIPTAFVSDPVFLFFTKFSVSAKIIENVLASSPSRGGGVIFYIWWHKATELSTSLYSIIGVCFCLYGPFNYVLFHKFSEQILRSYFYLDIPFNYIPIFDSLPKWS